MIWPFVKTLLIQALDSYAVYAFKIDLDKLSGFLATKKNLFLSFF